jgi:hypothetical protein
MALIDLSNYATTLTQSTASRTGTPDGNIFFDVTNGTLEIITVEEQPTIIYLDPTHPTYTDGTSPVANPLIEDDGIRFEALYAFENQERRKDETLRQYDRYFKGTFKYGGAYELINSRKFDDASGSATSLTDDDRAKIRSSGWIERAADGGVDRIYYGVKSLGNIEALSLPYYQLTDTTTVPIPFAKDGPIDETVQVYGNTGNVPSDVGAGTIDALAYLVNKVRTYGYNYDEKALGDSGVTEMGGYFSGFAIGETLHLTTVPAKYPLADVYTVPVAPFDGMTLEKLAVAQTETGFTTADGDFSWVLNNTGDGTLDQCVAFLDALAQTDDDIDTGIETTTNGQRVKTWYTYNASGQIVTRSGADSLGLFIEQIPTADQQKIVFTDDVAAIKAYPFNVAVNVTTGAIADADALAWFHAFFLTGAGDEVGNDYGTATAITVLDNVGTAVKSTSITGSVQSFTFDYDGDVVAGSGSEGTDKDVVYICEGDGGATQAKTVIPITRSAIVAATCSPALETNV